MVDFLLRALHPMRQPWNDVIGVIGIDFAGVIEPWIGLRGVAELDSPRSIVVEARHFRALDPNAVDHQAILYQHRIAWAPCHLLHRSVLIEPFAGQLGDDHTVLALWAAVLVQHRHARQSAIYARL